MLVEVVGICINAMIIYYLNRLTKIGCKCAITSRRMSILYSSIFFIIVESGFLFSNTTGKPIPPVILGISSLVILSVSIVNVINTIKFVNEMKRENCDCSESVFRDLMYILAIIQICSWVMLIIFLIPVSLAILGSKKINKVSKKS